MTRPPALAWLPKLYAAVCVLFAILTLLAWDGFRHLEFLGIWQVFDWQDINVYWQSSRWVAGAGTLYREVPSEYPLLPNLLFGAVHLLSRAVPLADGYDRFAWVWVSLMLPLYFVVLHRLLTRFPRPAVLLWLTPTAIHFTLYRYDVLAVLFSLLAVEAIHEDRLKRAALMLGVVTALKGYTLFLLPALAVYVWQRRSFADALLAVVLQLAPFLAGNLVTLAFGGVEGLTFAYRFHAARWLNGESTFDAVAYAGAPGIRDWLAAHPRVPMILQATCALLAAAMRPRTPADLMRAFLFATTAFVSFSVFYSPQFVLWLVPFVADGAWPIAAWIVGALSWTTFAYFPVAFFKRVRWPGLFEATVTIVAALRIALLVVSGLGAGRRRESPAGTPITEPSGATA